MCLPFKDENVHSILLQVKKEYLLSNIVYLFIIDMKTYFAKCFVYYYYQLLFHSIHIFVSLIYFQWGQK